MTIFEPKLRIMKKGFYILLLTVLFINCSDGDLSQEVISFDSVSTQSCSNNGIIYKIKEQEALLIQIPTSAFTNEPTAVDSPTIIDINSTNRVVYRFYNGAISSSMFCETIPPSSPTVNDEWIATAGKIYITTTAIKTTNTATGQTSITGYNHNIVFKNITFAKQNGTQVYETFAFGDYSRSITPVALGFDETLEQCSASKQIYNFNSGESITLDNISTDLIKNQITPLNNPRTALIGTTSNKLVYRSYTNGIVTPNYFCSTTTPTVPTINQEWIAEAGVANVKGIIEVTTTNVLNTYTHRIVLKKVTLNKGNNNFTLGDSYILGDLITTNNVVKRSYINFFPTAFLSRSLGKNHSLSLSYSRRIDRPDYDALNPFEFFLDQYTFNRGNPFLNPQLSNSYEMAYTFKQQYNLSINYSVTNDVITDVLLPDDAKKALFQTKKNLDQQINYGFNLSIPATITKWWNSNNNIGGFYLGFRANDLQGEIIKTGENVLQFNSQHNFVISNTFGAEISGNYTSAMEYGIIRINPQYSIDAGINKSLMNKKLSLKLALSDIFDTRIQNIESAYPGLNYNLSQKNETRIAKISLSYKFGKNDIKPSRRRATGLESEQGRLKN